MGGTPAGTTYSAQDIALDESTTCPWYKNLTLAINMSHPASQVILRIQLAFAFDRGRRTDQLRCHFLSYFIIHVISQAYFDSVVELYDEWGIDLLKQDCSFGGDLTPSHWANVQGGLALCAAVLDCFLSA